jgi:hypothetical protein
MRMEMIFRAEHGRILATLIRLLSDIDVAEHRLFEWRLAELTSRKVIQYRIYRAFRTPPSLSAAVAELGRSIRPASRQ